MISAFRFLKGGWAYSPEQAVYRANEIGGDKWVVKAQIHSGARGKAGGILFCDSNQAVWDAAENLLGRKLVTRKPTLKEKSFIDCTWNRRRRSSESCISVWSLIAAMSVLWRSVQLAGHGYRRGGRKSP